MNKYYKNFILCSELDYHCILCEESFEIVPDVEKHIRWEQHRHRIKNQRVIPQYKELLHKIGKIYYCEICNFVANSDNVLNHLKSADHKENRENLSQVDRRIVLRERDESGFIKFPKLLINRLQWHGINKGNCLFCNEITEDVNNHISTTKHMAYIIQNKIIETNYNYFRTVDEITYYCFRCSNVIKQDQLHSHKCKKENRKRKNRNKNAKGERKLEMPDLLKILPDFEEDEYDINIQRKTAECWVFNEFINTTVNALNNYKEQYYKETIKYVLPKDHGKQRQDLAVYGREHFIKLNKGGSKGYCTLCDAHISANINVVKEHVNGLRHKGHLELKGLRPRAKHSSPGYKTMGTLKFIKKLYPDTLFDQMCINNTYCVDYTSLMFIANIRHNQRKSVKLRKRKCFCCDIDFYNNELEEHWTGRKHRNACKSADVLLIDKEFIRVIRPGLFHCGFCNKVFPFWESMEKHLASWRHGIAKYHCNIACNLDLQWYSDQETNGGTGSCEFL